MRVTYHLNSHDVQAVASEAAWAEAMGYDGVSANETAHDPFLALTLAATATSRVTLETHVAIAFPVPPWWLPTRRGTCRTCRAAASGWAWVRR